MKNRRVVALDELLYWIEEGSLLTKTLALLILDEKTGGEVSRVWKSVKSKKISGEGCGQHSKNINRL